MEVTRLADDLICFSFTGKELQDENIDIDNISQENYMDKLKPLMDKLVLEAAQTYEFKFEGQQATAASYIDEGTLKVVFSSTKRSISEIQNMIAKQERKHIQDEFIEDELAANAAKKEQKKRQRKLGFIVEFDSLREVIDLAKIYRLPGIKSTLYRNAQGSKYILAVMADKAENIIFAGNIILEYTAKNLKPLRSIHLLDEHMEIVAKDNAYEMLSAL